MALSAATAPARSILKKNQFSTSSILAIKAAAASFRNSKSNNNTNNNLKENKQQQKVAADTVLKRRTRSDRALDEQGFSEQYVNDNCAHVPVLVGEVVDVFSSLTLNSFVDCTLGAGGHSAQIIQAHPEMKLFVGFDVDPVALEMAQARISGLLCNDSGDLKSNLKVLTYLKNFKYIKSVLHDIDEKVLATGFQGILMDLGMSSMQVNNAARGFSVLSDGPLDMRMNPQASLKAEDILNSWPDVEIGRILREYGEESNWYALQKKIVKARSTGGLHSTRELVGLIRNSTSLSTGGRHGWIKTATRVFQALRIAVNDELNTLKDSIHASFDTLASGGRLAVISFHSLEDRVVKHAFLNIISSGVEDVEERCLENNPSKFDGIDNSEKEAWVKQKIQGVNATILTKRPITPSESEERLNPRSRSAKLRVIQKV